MELGLFFFILDSNLTNLLIHLVDFFIDNLNLDVRAALFLYDYRQFSSFIEDRPVEIVELLLLRANGTFEFNFVFKMPLKGFSVRKDIFQAYFSDGRLVFVRVYRLRDLHWDVTTIGKLAFERGDLVFKLRNKISVLTDVVLYIQHVPLDAGLNILSPIGILKSVVRILVVARRWSNIGDHNCPAVTTKTVF